MKKLLKPQQRSHSVKREQKKSLFFRTISSFLSQLSLDEPAVRELFVTKVDLSQDSGICYVYFAAYQEPGQGVFDNNIERLKLYKPSLRKAIADALNPRYVPDIIFLFDKHKEKERRVDALIHRVQEELGLQPQQQPSDNK